MHNDYAAIQKHIDQARLARTVYLGELIAQFIVAALHAPAKARAIVEGSPELAPAKPRA